MVFIFLMSFKYNILNVDIPSLILFMYNIMISKLFKHHQYLFVNKFQFRKRVNLLSQIQSSDIFHTPNIFQRYKITDCPI